MGVGMLILPSHAKSGEKKDHLITSSVRMVTEY
jgi:hypothetical protein